MGKVILTNRSALQRKYGHRSSDIEAAIQALIQSDRGRSIETRVVALDSPEAMQDIGPTVTDPKNQAQTKAAVDAVFRQLGPDYILLLGAIDVISHQDLRNPAYRSGFDDDPVIPSDLPYACEGPWSDDPKDFIAVTRVVGRLPDITGSSEPSYLIGLLESAANATALARADFGEYFGITAQVWERSTTLSLEAIFGSSGDMQQVPPDDYQWPPDLLGRRAHFINCHGAPSVWQFFGQPRGVETYPVAQDGTYIPGKVASGTVVAAECCYGSQLYDPSPTNAASPGLCNVYLENGAYGFFGSSTIAYGPADSNDWADHLCQYFLRAILQGSSLGSAVLRARQDYVKERATLDPIDLKTLAQFNVLGDPSIHPVAVPVADQPVPHRMAVGGPDPQAQSLAVGRTGRRRSMFVAGIAIARATAVAVPNPAPELGSVSEILQTLATAVNIPKPEIISYDIQQPAQVLEAVHGMRLSPAERERIHVIMGRGGSGTAPAPQITALVAKEENGQIVNYRTAYSR